MVPEYEGHLQNWIRYHFRDSWLHYYILGGHTPFCRIERIPFILKSLGQAFNLKRFQDNFLLQEFGKRPILEN